MNSAGRLVLPRNLVQAAGPQEQAWLATVLPVVVEQVWPVRASQSLPAEGT
jgi:hypothetical protein